MMQSIVGKILGRGRSLPTLGDTSVSSSASFVSSNPNTSALQAPPSSIIPSVEFFQRVPSAPKKRRTLLRRNPPHQRTRILESVNMIWFELYSDTSKPSTRVTFGDNTIHRVPEMKIPGWNDELGALVDRNYAEMDSIRSRSKKAGKKVRDAMARYGMNDESLPTALEAMFKDCYTREDLEAFKLACEAQCDEWRISEEASTGPVPEIETQPEPKSSSTVPATQGDVVVESAEPLASLTPIASDLDDDSTMVSHSTEELNEMFPITLPTAVQDVVAVEEEEEEVDEPEFPLIGTIIEVPSEEEHTDSTLPAIVQEDAGVEATSPRDLDDDSTMVSHSTEEMNEMFPITLPTVVQDAVAVEESLASDLDDDSTMVSQIIEVPSEEESSDSTLPTVVQEDAGVEAAAPQDDVVFDTAGDEPFDIEVDDEVEQVTTVSDGEHESIVSFLAAFATADVPVEEDEAPAPVAIETPVIHEDDVVEALAEVAVEEPLGLNATVEQSRSKVHLVKELESKLDGHYWAISESRSRRKTSFFVPC